MEQQLMPTMRTVLQAYKPDHRYSKYFNVGYQSRVMLGAAGADKLSALALRYATLLIVCLMAHVLILC